jgi:hypothetical protein
MADVVENSIGVVTFGVLSSALLRGRPPALARGSLLHAIRWSLGLEACHGAWALKEPKERLKKASSFS